MHERLKTYLQPRAFLAFAFASGAAAVFVQVTSHFRGHTSISQLDRNILIWAAHFRTPAVTGVAMDFTALGSPTILTLISIIAIFLLLLGNHRMGALRIVVASCGAGILTEVAKNFFDRARPDVVEHLVYVTSFSYPSGHSLSSSAIYLTMALLAFHIAPSWGKRTAILVLATILIVGVAGSRIYLGVHYPSDVLSGIFVGGAWAFLVEAVWRVTSRKSEI